MLSDCFAMDNVIYRADFLNMEFESLKDYEELQEKEKNRVMGYLVQYAWTGPC